MISTQLFSASRLSVTLLYAFQKWFRSWSKQWQMVVAISSVCVLAVSPALAASNSDSKNNRFVADQAGYADRTDLNLPDLGDSSEQTLSYREQRSIGVSVVKQLFKLGLIMEDPEIQDYIQTLGAQVASGIPREVESARPPVEFYVIDDGQINAFALPGGFVAVNRGLIVAAKNEAELAGVLAHELAHVEQLHIARSLEKSQKLDVLLAGAVLAALVFGGGDPQATQAALSIGLAGSVQGKINFTREHEYEADRVGIGYLHNAGFDPHGMVHFFERLQEKDRYYSNDVPEILRTHPVSGTRIQEARQRAERMQSGRLGQGSERFYLARERLRILGSRAGDNIYALYKNNTALPELPLAPLRYARGLAETQLGRYDLATETIKPLLDNVNPQIEYVIALARAYQAAGQGQLALQTVEQARMSYKNDSALAIIHAEVLFEQRQRAAAKARLLDSLEAQKIAYTWRLLADITAAMGNNGEAHLYMSEYYLINRGVRDALKQLELGAQRSDNSPFEQQRLEARLDEIRDAIGESHDSRHWQDPPKLPRTLIP